MSLPTLEEWARSPSPSFNRAAQRKGAMRPASRIGKVFRRAPNTWLWCFYASPLEAAESVYGEALRWTAKWGSAVRRGIQRDRRKNGQRERQPRPETGPMGAIGPCGGRGVWNGDAPSLFPLIRPVAPCSFFPPPRSVHRGPIPL